MQHVFRFSLTWSGAGEFSKNQEMWVKTPGVLFKIVVEV